MQKQLTDKCQQKDTTLSTVSFPPKSNRSWFSDLTHTVKFKSRTQELNFYVGTYVMQRVM